MKVKNVGHRPIWITGGIRIMPGEIKEIPATPDMIKGLRLEILEEIPKSDFKKLVALKGVEDELAKALLRKFGTLERIKSANIEELMSLPGIGRKRAILIKNQLEESSQAVEEPLEGE